jgi:hypothetical protein
VQGGECKEEIVETEGRESFVEFVKMRGETVRMWKSLTDIALHAEKLMEFADSIPASLRSLQSLAPVSHKELTTLVGSGAITKNSTREQAKAARDAYKSGATTQAKLKKEVKEREAAAPPKHDAKAPAGVKAWWELQRALNNLNTLLTIEVGGLDKLVENLVQHGSLRTNTSLDLHVDEDNNLVIEDWGRRGLYEAPSHGDGWVDTPGQVVRLTISHQKQKVCDMGNGVGLYDDFGDREKAMESQEAAKKRIKEGKR